MFEVDLLMRFENFAIFLRDGTDRYFLILLDFSVSSLSALLAVRLLNKLPSLISSFILPSLSASILITNKVKTWLVSPDHLGLSLVKFHFFLFLLYIV